MHADLPPTVSRPDLLVDGCDDLFRLLITDLLAFGAALREAREEIAAASGMSAPQYAILMAIARSRAPGGPGVSDVSAALRVSVPFVVAQTRALVAAGMVRKQTDAGDRRRVHLQLTPACRRALARLAPVQQRVNDALFAGLDAAGFRALQAAMQALTGALAPAARPARRR